MEIKVLWTQTALKNLEEIFEYHKFKASVNIAQKLVKQIVEATLALENNPDIGRIEELLYHRKFVYRFIVVRKYKIIYRKEGNRIFIISVFDTRQNPNKIKRL